MIKITSIITHGTNVEFVKLLDEIIECPECSAIGIVMDGRFKYRKTSRDGDFFEITCNKCECKFTIQIQKFQSL